MAQENDKLDALVDLIHKIEDGTEISLTLLVRDAGLRAAKGLRSFAGVVYGSTTYNWITNTFGSNKLGNHTGLSRSAVWYGVHAKGDEVARYIEKWGEKWGPYFDLLLQIVEERRELMNLGRVWRSDDPLASKLQKSASETAIFGAKFVEDATLGTAISGARLIYMSLHGYAQILDLIGAKSGSAEIRRTAQGCITILENADLIVTTFADPRAQSRAAEEFVTGMQTLNTNANVNATHFRPYMSRRVHVALRPKRKSTTAGGKSGSAGTGASQPSGVKPRTDGSAKDDSIPKVVPENGTESKDSVLDKIVLKEMYPKDIEEGLADFNESASQSGSASPPPKSK